MSHLAQTCHTGNASYQLQDQQAASTNHNRVLNQLHTDAQADAAAAAAAVPHHQPAAAAAGAQQQQPLNSQHSEPMPIKKRRARNSPESASPSGTMDSKPGTAHAMRDQQQHVAGTAAVRGSKACSGSSSMRQRASKRLVFQQKQLASTSFPQRDSLDAAANDADGSELAAVATVKQPFQTTKQKTLVAPQAESASDEAVLEQEDVSNAGTKAGAVKLAAAPAGLAQQPPSDHRDVNPLQHDIHIYRGQIEERHAALEAPGRNGIATSALQIQHAPGTQQAQHAQQTQHSQHAQQAQHAPQAQQAQRAPAQQHGAPVAVPAPASQQGCPLLHPQRQQDAAAAPSQRLSLHDAEGHSQSGSGSQEQWEEAISKLHTLVAKCSQDQGMQESPHDAHTAQQQASQQPGSQQLAAQHKSLHQGVVQQESQQQAPKQQALKQQASKQQALKQQASQQQVSPLQASQQVPSKQQQQALQQQGSARELTSQQCSLHQDPLQQQVLHQQPTPEQACAQLLQTHCIVNPKNASSPGKAQRGTASQQPQQDQVIAHNASTAAAKVPAALGKQRQKVSASEPDAIAMLRKLLVPSASHRRARLAATSQPAAVALGSAAAVPVDSAAPVNTAAPVAAGPAASRCKHQQPVAAIVAAIVAAAPSAAVPPASDPASIPRSLMKKAAAIVSTCTHAGPAAAPKSAPAPKAALDVSNQAASVQLCEAWQQAGAAPGVVAAQSVQNQKQGIASEAGRHRLQRPSSAKSMLGLARSAQQEHADEPQYKQYQQEHQKQHQQGQQHQGQAQQQQQGQQQQHHAVLWQAKKRHRPEGQMHESSDQGCDASEQPHGKRQCIESAQTGHAAVHSQLHIVQGEASCT